LKTILVDNLNKISLSTMWQKGLKDCVWSSVPDWEF